ncbi:MAG: hypothetical protein HY828_13150 [Actinobacteria bacterium]|nr:hypothetical protein [Actinomycetota bacterium]
MSEYTDAPTLDDDSFADRTPPDGPLPDGLEPAFIDDTEPAPPSLLRRVWRRIIRRPANWLNAPWPTERIVQYLTALVVVGGATFAVLQVVHLDLVFQNNTPTGGDMGAHVMAPAYLRDHLLPNGQITGWSNYWYNGFPLYRFYMVVPALLIVGLNVVFPYGIAFKIVACLGIVSLPFCCWAFGRLARFRFPIPELMSLAGLAFLFDESFSIYGGNVKSTMAGEFSFSIALSLAILGLGLFARGLETGKYRNWSAIVLALAILSHGIVAIFVVLGALLMWLVWMDKTRFIYGLTMGITAVMLSAFWIFPFLANHEYMTDMKYGYRPDGGGDSFWDMFFPWPAFIDIVVTGFALIGFVSSVVRRHLNGAWLGIMCFALMAATFLARDSLPVIGLLWNPRLLPFLYLVRLMLMMVGIVDTAYFLVRAVRGRELSTRAIWVTGVSVAAVVGLVVMSMELFLFREMPGARLTTKNEKEVYAWGINGWDPITLTPSSTDALADGWTRYNFAGYEGRPAYGEYKALVDTMAGLGDDTDPSLGCGRALWENNGDTGAYGTTMALMLLPHWTDGCIQSQEGLFFEASGTTPYHFLSAAAMSANSSNPVRELRYTDNDASVGVPMMQKMGIKYLMVFTADAKAQAHTRSDLVQVATSGPWEIFTVSDSPVVEALRVQPVVVNPRSGDQRERHLELGTSWFQNPQEWAAMPADDGPADWQRIDVQVDMTRRVGSEPLEPGRKVDIVVPSETIEVHELPEVTVSNAKMGDQDFSFDVSEVGVPVLVKISYFPNWKATGADGPYRVSPNFMVVVPTDTHVTLIYESSGLDKASYVITFLGIGLLFFWRFKRGDVRHRTTHPFLGTPVDDLDDLDGGDLSDGLDEPGYGDPGFVPPPDDPAYDDTRFDMSLDPLLLPPPGPRDDPAGPAGSV